jgi:RNA polymerase sigma-70 factor (sigma-E family)
VEQTSVFEGVAMVPEADEVAERPAESVPAVETGAGTDGFELWYAENFERLVKLAYLLVGSQEAARDLTQDAMVRVLRKWRTIDHPDHYARRAVVNACNSHHRRRALARRHPQPGPESYELEAQELSDALAQLPPRQRAALVLRYWGDLPEADIADAIGVKRSTVASLLRRAHAQLKETIDHD